MKKPRALGPSCARTTCPGPQRRPARRPAIPHVLGRTQRSRPAASTQPPPLPVVLPPLTHCCRRRCLPRLPQEQDGWERSDFPIVCSTCLGPNPFVRMQRVRVRCRGRGAGAAACCSVPLLPLRQRAHALTSTACAARRLSTAGSATSPTAPTPCSAGAPATTRATRRPSSARRWPRPKTCARCAAGLPGCREGRRRGAAGGQAGPRAAAAVVL